MDNIKKFKGSLFGFSKKSVNDYVVGLSEDFSKRIAELEAQLKDANEQIKQKDEKIAELDAQRLHVAETILKSKVEADQIVNSAQSTADTMISNAQSEATGLVNTAKNEAELIIDEARTEAVELKRISENELRGLEEQKEYVSQCINSLKLDVLSAYEVYMLKLEKSMERHDAIELESSVVEVEKEDIKEDSCEKAENTDSKPEEDTDFNF